jgi:hypothetical protein
MKKVLVTIGVALTLLASSVWTQEHKPIDMTGADRYLANFYGGSNDVYFDGKLPKNVTVLYEPNVSWNGDEDLGLTTNDYGTHYTIRINSYYVRDMKHGEMTMYHEECHLATWNEFNQHGPAWKQCMRRLAEQGAFDELW